MGRTIKIKGWSIELLPEYDNKYIRKQLEELLGNHVYNINIDWVQYRKVGKKWRNNKKRTS